MKPRILSSLAFPTLLIAGSSTAQNIPAPTRRDSAGVRIVDHRTIETSAVAFRITPRPVLDLGGIKANPAAELHPSLANIVPRRLSDGRFVVHSLASLQVFGANGNLLQTIGRPGQGPGEFVEILTTCVGRGDTIHVVSVPRTITTFDGAGALIATSRLQSSAGFLNEGCYSDGSMLIEQSAVAASGARLPAPLVSDDRFRTFKRIRGDGTTLRDVATVPVQRSFAITSIYNAVVQNDSVYLGDGRLPQFMVADGSGRITRIVRWHGTPIPVTNATRLNAISGVGGGTTVSTYDAERSGTLPKNVPWYQRIVVDLVGRVWLSDHELAPLPRGYTVFSAAGDLLGRVIVPDIGADSRRVTVVGFRGREVILRWRDRDGAQHLSFHTLTPGA